MKNAGLSQYGAAGIVARWAAIESPGGPTSVNPISGAAGIAQGLGSRKAGYQGTLDEQLANAARELKGSESKAGDILRAAKTPEEGSRGASMFERAEGYNGSTGFDNFTNSTPTKKVFDTVFGAPAAPAAPAPTAPRSAPGYDPNAPWYAKPTPEPAAPSGDLAKDFGPGGRWSKSNPNNPALTWGVIKAAPAPGAQSFNNSSSSSSAALHANTTINVTGGADPTQVGQHVARAQSRLNADLIRNLQGAVA